MIIEKRVIRLEHNGLDGSDIPVTDCDPADFQSPLPTEHEHVFYSDQEIGLNVGVWDATSIEEEIAPYPGDEFVWVLEGEFTMVHDNGEAVQVHKNDCAFSETAFQLVGNRNVISGNFISRILTQMLKRRKSNRQKVAFACLIPM